MLDRAIHPAADDAEQQNPARRQRASGGRRLLLTALLAGCGQATLHSGSRRLPHDIWEAPPQVLQAGLGACDPRLPLSQPPPDPLGPPCAELGQLPVVLAAAEQCLGSGGHYDPGSMGCRCPAGQWQVPASGCQPRGPARADADGGGGQRADAARPLSLLADGQVRVGGLQLKVAGSRRAHSARLAEALLAAGPQRDEAAEQLLASLLPVGRPATGPAAPAWLAGDDLGQLLLPAVAALSGTGWAQQRPPAVVTLWRQVADPRQKDTMFDRFAGAPQGRCRRAWAQLGGAAPPDEHAHPCAQLQRLRDGLRQASATQGGWRVIYQATDTPAPGLNTLMGHLADGPANGQVQWLLHGEVVVHRRLHLQLPEGLWCAFVDAEGNLIGSLFAAADAGGPSSQRLGGGLGWRAFDRKFAPLSAALGSLRPPTR